MIEGTELAAMPFVQIHMLEGATPEQVTRLIAEVTETVSRVLEKPAERVRILVTEVPKSHWGIGGVTAEKLGR